MMHAWSLPAVEPHAEMPDRVAALLRALGIEEVVYALDGGGDSGDASLDAVRFRDGRDAVALPELAIGFGFDGCPRLLDDYLNGVASDLPEGDWVNNEGGYGSVTMYPFEPDPVDRFTCDMTYRDEYEDEEPEEEDWDPEPFEAIAVALDAQVRP